MPKASRDIPDLSRLKQEFYSHERAFCDVGRVTLPLKACEATLDCNDFVRGHSDAKGCFYLSPLRTADGKIDETLDDKILRRAIKHMVRIMQERLAPLDFDFAISRDNPACTVTIPSPGTIPENQVSDLERRLAAAVAIHEHFNQPIASREIIDGIMQRYHSKLEHDKPREKIARLLFNAFAGACLELRTPLINAYSNTKDKGSMAR